VKKWGQATFFLGRFPLTKNLLKKSSLSPISLPPIPFLAAVFSLGIIIEHFADFSFTSLFAVACFLILAIFIFFKRNICFDVFVIVFFLLLGALAYKNHNTLPPKHIYYQLPPSKTRAFCIGTVIDDPKEKEGQFLSRRTSFNLGVNFLNVDGQWRETEGKILVTGYGRKEIFNYGDKLLIEGNIQRPSPPTNPHQFNYKEFLRQNKTFALFNISKNDLVKKIGTEKLNFIKKYAFLLRHKLKSKIERCIACPHAALLQGMLLGFRGDIPREVQNLFVKTGTMHLLSISGLHVGLVILVVMFLLRIINLPRKVRFFLILLFLLFYAPLTGLRVPVVRASIMAAVLLIGFLLERESDIVDSLGIAALIILFLCPNQIFSAGFQLSFICLLSIVCI